MSQAERAWVRVAVQCPLEAEDAVTGALLPLSPNGLSTLGTGPITVSAWVGPMRPEDDTSGVEQRAREALEEIPDYLLPRPIDMKVTLVPETDWIEAFRAHHRPVRIGRIVVKPSWEEWPNPALPARSDDILLELDPGLAFGTGLHPTTRICLNALQDRMRRGDRVVDFGCGSGILAIAAALLGAREVLAIDADPSAVRVAEANVRNNGLEDVVTTHVGDSLTVAEPGWNIVIANINPVVVAQIAEDVARILEPGGTYICTGIPINREARVLEALREERFDGITPRISGDWIGFICTTPG